MMRARFLGEEGFGTYDIDWSGPTFRRIDGEADVLVVPGFVDLHIHGAFGIDFMTASAGDMSTLCSRLEGLGYEAFLPTTVTASPEAVMTALHSLPDHRAIAGFHLEGPFISANYPGAQPFAFIDVPPERPSAGD